MMLSVDAIAMRQKYETPIGQPSRQISASSFLGENEAFDDGDDASGSASSSDESEGRASEPSPSSN